MDRILELLEAPTVDDISIAVSLLTPELLEASPEQSKHKLKTRISALLKSSGTTRAYGAVLARLAINDWSIVKSHGSTWATIMLHVLDLPDHVCWSPITKTLAVLFSKVHGKSDLSREVAGSKIGDFMKRLVLTVDTTEAYAVVSQMLTLYPTQCRPYINKLEPILAASSKPDASYALACLCISEKQGAAVWKTKVSEVLSELTPSLDERQLWVKLQVLASYIRVASRCHVAIPVNLIVDRAVLNLLASLKPHCVTGGLEFVSKTLALLKTSYLQKFDILVYRIAEVVDMGKREALQAFSVLQAIVVAAGWIPENYTKLFSRLTKKAISIWNERGSSSSGAEGLADYVQNASNFASCNLSPVQMHTLLEFLTTVATHVVQIPQSVRVVIDKIVVGNGTDRQITQVTLYPGKYSLLPLSIHKMPTIPGLECLVHPRFPPLKISKHMLDEQYAPADEEEQVFKSESVAEPEPTAEPEPEAKPETEPEVEQQNTTKSVPLPPIPESTKPVHKPELSTPPEKRAKREHPESVQPPAPSVQPITVQSEPTQSKDNDDSIEEDDDNDLVIPTLTMDSD